MSCNRCGQCCMDIGTFWAHSEHPVLKVILQEVSDSFFRDTGRCTMLKEIDGIETCLIHKHLGFNAKPQACREHKGDSRCIWIN